MDLWGWTKILKNQSINLPKLREKSNRQISDFKWLKTKPYIPFKIYLLSSNGFESQSYHTKGLEHIKKILHEQL